MTHMARPMLKVIPPRPAWRAFALLAVLLLNGPARAGCIPDWAVTATGVGEVEVAPDLAYFKAGTVAIARSANDTKDAAATTARAVLSALAAQGVVVADVQTSIISLSPVLGQPDARDPNRPQSELQIESYRARISHRITVHNLADRGHVIDAALGAGAQEIGSVGFGVADRAAIESRALRAAISDARRMAETIAEEGKLRLESIISATVIASGDGVTPARPVRAAMRSFQWVQGA